MRAEQQQRFAGDESWEPLGVVSCAVCVFRESRRQAPSQGARRPRLQVAGLAERASSTTKTTRRRDDERGACALMLAANQRRDHHES